MSAYMVGRTHIDALLTAGLVLPRPNGPMRWCWPPIGPEDRGAYQPGEPWGAGWALLQERSHELTEDTATEVGGMLLAANRASVNHRYHESQTVPPYEFRRLSGTPDPLIILNTVAGYEYQSCEHREWPISHARAFVDALEHVAIGRIHGVANGHGWHIDDPNVFLKPTLLTDLVVRSQQRLQPHLQEHERQGGLAGPTQRPSHSGPELAF